MKYQEGMRKEKVSYNVFLKGSSPHTHIIGTLATNVGHFSLDASVRKHLDEKRKKKKLHT